MTYLIPDTGTLSQTIFFLYPTLARYMMNHLTLLVWLSSKQNFLLARYLHTVVPLPIRGGHGLTSIMFRQYVEELFVA